MPELTLYIGNKNYSSWSLRPWLVLRQTGQPFREELIPLDQPDTAERIARIAPHARVPVLVHGELKIWESLAICEYLAETFPEARLWPDGSPARAIARAVSNEMHAGFAHLRQALSMDIRKRKSAARTPEVEKDIRRVTQLWRDCRAEFGQHGPFLFGHFTIADAMYAPVVTRFRTYGVELGQVEEQYARAVEALPAMQDWLAAARAEPWDLPNH